MIGAILVGVLSVVYAVAYLVVAPSEQRGDDVAAALRSYLAHPAGLRVASLCLAVSGLVSGFVLVIVARRLGPSMRSPVIDWAVIVAVVAGLATAADGLGDLIGLDRLAHRYATGDATVRGAVLVVHDLSSPVDPRGLATFLAAGLVTAAFGAALRTQAPRLGVLGLGLGVDLVVLFAATALGVAPLVLIAGGLASVVLGPLWWFGLAGFLPRPADDPRSS